MKTLIYAPRQANAILVVGGEERAAGETFEVSDEDAAELLGDPRYEVSEAPTAEPKANPSGVAKATTNGKTKTQSPGHSDDKNGGQ